MTVNDATSVRAFACQDNREYSDSIARNLVTQFGREYVDKLTGRNYSGD